MYNAIMGMAKKYREQITYLFFGALTTLVNALVYFPARWLTAGALGERASLVVSTALAWVVAVAFAYVTNKRWVFRAKSDTASQLAREAGLFFWARAAGFLLDAVIKLFGVDYLRLDETAVYVAANVCVIVFNYVASKTVVFKRRGD